MTNSLGADVNLTVSAQYQDGPSVAQGSTGTWCASGNAVLLDTTALATFNCKLWDGTTIFDSAIGITTAANNPVDLHLSGFLASPAGNIRISCADGNGTPAGKIKSNASGNSKDSTISVFRIQ